MSKIRQFIGQRVKKAREEIGISQELLGKKVPYAAATISQLESGQFRISLEALEKIAKVLDKPLSYFLPEERSETWAIPTKLKVLERELAEIKRALTKETARARQGFFQVIVCGNIGAGKRDLVKLLAKEFNGKAISSDVSKNLYINDYYKDMKRWAIPSQLYFLMENFRQQKKIAQSVVPVFQDQSFHEQFRVFIQALYEYGILKERDYKTFEEIYLSLLEFIPKPDLLVYLRASVPFVLKRIKEKGEEFEKVTPKSYFQKLDEKYEEWTKSFDLAPVLTFDVEKLNFWQNQKNFNKIAEEIRSAL